MSLRADIRAIESKKFIGMKIPNSFTNNRVQELWSTFMPRRHEVVNAVSTEYYSIECFPTNYFEEFNPETPFEKWAAMEVASIENVPKGMDSLISPSGEYAVFIHYGPAKDGPKTYQKIFMEWLPKSNYQLDDRPHFAVMGEKYKGDDLDSEEEIWIPVKSKK